MGGRALVNLSPEGRAAKWEFSRILCWNQHQRGLLFLDLLEQSMDFWNRLTEHFLQQNHVKEDGWVLRVEAHPKGVVVVVFVCGGGEGGTLTTFENDKILTVNLSLLNQSFCHSSSLAFSLSNGFNIHIALQNQCGPVTVAASTSWFTFTWSTCVKFPTQQCLNNQQQHHKHQCTTIVPSV